MRYNRTKIAAAAIAAVVSGVWFAPGAVSAASHPRVTLSIQITGTPSASTNAVFTKLVKEYESAHPGVTVNWVVEGPSVNALTNAITKGAAHEAPDVIIGPQYGSETSGVVPPGFLVNLMPYMKASDPYVGGKTWLSTWDASAIDFYRTSTGAIYSTPGSEVSTAIYYNKADFARAGISKIPKTWTQWIADMKKLKSSSISPFLMGTGNNCTDSWFERKVVSSLIQPQLSAMEVNKQQVLTGLDVAVGIKKGILSMSNPRYAEAWKLLGSLKPYLYPGESTFEACGNVSGTSTPLSNLLPFVQGKVAMVWDGAWQTVTLNQVFKNKYGLFAFPEITTATTSYAANKSFTGDVGGPNGANIWAVTSTKANGGSPAVVDTAVNLLEWVTSPKNDGPYVKSSEPGTLPVVKGASVGPLPPGIKSLLPKGKAPIATDGILDSELAPTPAEAAQRLIEAYVGGSMTWATFSKQWQAVLENSATTWAKTNKVNLSKYVK